MGLGYECKSTDFDSLLNKAKVHALKSACPKRYPHVQLEQIPQQPRANTHCKQDKGRVWQGDASDVMQAANPVKQSISN